jgi:hypothetical protein
MHNKKLLKSISSLFGCLIAAVYAIGLGRISKMVTLLTEAVTMCIDTEMHQSAETWDLCGPIEVESAGDCVCS